MELITCNRCGIVFDLDTINKDPKYYKLHQELAIDDEIIIDISSYDGRVKEFKCPVCRHNINCD
ncbi:MAG: hypothetical protein KAK00_00390 [Nanoarchaeota archaeon]|nr:hypothetical protein [Nanoarchaeota archaeon]